MPISRDEWDAGRTWATLEAQILTFLRRDKKKAFNITEVMNGLGYQVDTRSFLGFLSGVASVWGCSRSFEKVD